LDGRPSRPRGNARDHGKVTLPRRRLWEIRAPDLANRAGYARLLRGDNALVSFFLGRRKYCGSTAPSTGDGVAGSGAAGAGCSTGNGDRRVTVRSAPSPQSAHRVRNQPGAGARGLRRLRYGVSVGCPEVEPRGESEPRSVECDATRQPDGARQDLCLRAQSAGAQEGHLLSGRFVAVQSTRPDRSRAALRLRRHGERRFGASL
jgi:hypothetical protein